MYSASASEDEERDQFVTWWWRCFTLILLGRGRGWKASYGLPIGIFFAQLSLTVYWLVNRIQHEAKDVVIGNMCVSKAPNLYVPALSSFAGLLVLADVFALSMSFRMWSAGERASDLHLELVR